MARLFQISRTSSLLHIPFLDFLYPALLQSKIIHRKEIQNRYISTCPRLRQLIVPLHPDHHPLPEQPQISTRLLPQQCSGCGAYAQTTRPDLPGFFRQKRLDVAHNSARSNSLEGNRRDNEGNIFNEVISSLDKNQRSQLEGHNFHESLQAGQGFSKLHNQVESPSAVCDRCHQLIHHGSAEPAANLTIKSVRDILSESPYKYNHIYHILDAADYPLSLVPSLQRNLSLAPQRSKNRRSSDEQYKHGKRADVSFIISRADLLAPKKEQVDKLMPYLVEVLRDAIEGSGKDVRLGNVHCVSSHRGWWTQGLKEDIWNRGGGGWMIGKANVGKSSLFESIFPKGRSGIQQGSSSTQSSLRHTNPEGLDLNPGTPPFAGEIASGLSSSLLPPALPEQNYPKLPIVSPLPGTTVAPIRHVFGNGKGELIDLPGLTRGDMRNFITADHVKDLVMRQRTKPVQLTIKPGQSLIVGGLIRITPLDTDSVLLAYPFVPLPTHVTDADKAKEMFEKGTFPAQIGWNRPGAERRMLHAGTFSIKWDVTKERTGPLTSRTGVGLKTDRLPFVVLSTDILIEGCGWIELVTQVRKRKLEMESQAGSLFDARPFPLIEIHSPDGRHIGVRRPMGAWALYEKKPGTSKRVPRPKPSMKGMKKHLKRTMSAN